MISTWSAPSEGTIFGVSELNAEPVTEFMNKYQQVTGSKLTITTVILKALGVAFREAPTLNCRIVCDKFVPNQTIDLSCLVALDDGKDLASAKIVKADEKTFSQITEELNKKAEKLRKHQDKDFEATTSTLKILPVFLIKIIVEVAGWLSGSLGMNIPALGVRPFPFGTAMVTSVGMLGVEQAFVPFTPFARVSLLLMIGQIVKKPVVVDDKIVIRRQITLTATIDHRFVDGTEAAKLAKRLKFLVENPTELLPENERAPFLSGDAPGAPGGPGRTAEDHKGAAS